MKKLLITLSLAAVTANAGLIADFTITQPGHLLEGATITSITSDAVVWEDLGYGSGLLNSGSNATTVTISGATGSGAVWNGSYDYDYATQPGTFPTLFGNSTWKYSALTSNGNSPRFTDGSGNSFYFFLASTSGTVTPSVGAAVVQENYGAVTSASFYHYSVSSNPIFTSASTSHGTGSFTVTAVPEPATLGLMGLSSGGLFFFRNMRRRKKAGITLVPVRSTRADEFDVSSPVQAVAPKAEPVVKQVIASKVTSSKQQVANCRKSISNRFIDSLLVFDKVMDVLKQKVTNGFDAFLALILK